MEVTQVCCSFAFTRFKGVTIHIPFDSIQFRVLPSDFDYFNSIIQNIIFFFYFLQHDTQCRQHTTLSPQLEDTMKVSHIIYLSGNS